MDRGSEEASGFLDHAWQRLYRGVADRHAAARHPSLVTIGCDGAPQVRTVVLRGADRAEGFLSFHTDLASAKVTEMGRDPRVALHVWDPKAKLQIRINARAERAAAEDEMHVWASLPEGARLVYGGNALPGSEIPRPDAFEAVPDAQRFGLFHCVVERIELLHLGTPHRRAAYHRDDHWRGTWLAP